MDIFQCIISYKIQIHLQCFRGWRWARTWKQCRPRLLYFPGKIYLPFYIWNFQFCKNFNLCNILAFYKVWSRFRIDFALQALQCSLILIILAITVITNISIVLNIRNSEIKRRIVSFLLIKNLCIVDTVGAMLILPVPLAATFRGEKWKRLIFAIAISQSSTSPCLP